MSSSISSNILWNFYPELKKAVKAWKDTPYITVKSEEKLEFICQECDFSMLCTPRELMDYPYCDNTHPFISGKLPTTSIISITEKLILESENYTEFSKVLQQHIMTKKDKGAFVRI